MKIKSNFWSFKKYCLFFSIIYIISGVLLGFLMSYKNRYSAFSVGIVGMPISEDNLILRFIDWIAWEYFFSSSIFIILFLITLILYKPIKKLISNVLKEIFNYVI